MYLEFSQYTHPGAYETILKQSLPDVVRDIGLLVRKSLVHAVTYANGNTGSNADLRYGDMKRIPWWRQNEDDVFPTASAMLSELYRRDPRGLTLERLPENKLIVTCRFTSILTACLLKIKGIPARVRSGFAPYFKAEGLEAGKSEDHWVNQYWNKHQSRWVTIDVDGSLEGYIPFDTYDMPEGIIDFPADAWLDVRTGKVDANHFHNAGGWSGLITIAWELFYDFHCIMNDEIIYFHHPAMATLDAFSKNSEEQRKEIDELAHLMQNPDQNFDALKKLWETKKEFRLLRGGLLG